MTEKIVNNDVDPEETTPYEYNNVLIFVAAIVTVILIIVLATFKG